MSGAEGHRVDLHALARQIDSRFPTLSDRGRRVAIATHRLLAEGAPVPEYAIAARTRHRIEEVKEEMAAWPGVYRDERGWVVGFWGLALSGTDHEIEVDGRQLRAWCAWDTLFLPGILGGEAIVRSRCAETDEPIELIVAPHGVKSPNDGDIVVSFVDPECADVTGDAVISTFCHHILFFASRDAGERWCSNRADGGFLLDLAAAFELGRLCNELRYGASLAAA